MVKSVSEDVVKVMVDYYGAPKKQRSKVDVGSFELVYRGLKAVDAVVPLYGVNLICEGKKMKLNELNSYSLSY